MMLERNIDVSEIIKKTDYENIDIITANMDLLEANLRTIVDTSRQQQTRFKKALSNSKVFRSWLGEIRLFTTYRGIRLLHHR